MAKRAKFYPWWVVVAYSDGDVDVVGCKTYWQALGSYQAAVALQKFDGVVDVQAFDFQGNCVLSGANAGLTMDVVSLVEGRYPADGWERWNDEGPKAGLPGAARP